VILEDSKYVSQLELLDPASVADLCHKLSDPELTAALTVLYKYVNTDAVKDSEVFMHVMDRVVTKTDFLEAPASSKFHLNYQGGLLRHSLGVTYRLWSLDGPYRLYPQYSYLDLFLVGLLHDLGKAGQVSYDEYRALKSIPYYSREAYKTKPGEYKYVRNTERTVMSVPMGSLHTISMLLSDVWKPSPDAYQAIGYHDGLYVPEGRHVAQSECKLLLALHHSDIYQCRYEGEWCKENWSA